MNRPHTRLALLALLAAACGDVGDTYVGRGTGDDGGGLGADRSAPGAPGAGGAGGEATSSGTAFAMPRDSVKLLPYAVRLSKLAVVLGAGTDAAPLELVRRKHLELGDADHANGIAADRTWTAAKLAAWTESIEPVCASAELAARFPALPSSLPALVEVAYGRRFEPEDRALVDEALAAVALDPQAQHEVTCLAILSSVEFVAR